MNVITMPNILSAYRQLWRPSAERDIRHICNIGQQTHPTVFTD
jgi:hypothetical protein